MLQKCTLVRYTASSADCVVESFLQPGCRYTGEKLLDELVEILLEAAWRPAPKEAFPNLPQSPRANGSGASAAAATGQQRASGYVAPHLRGSGACCILSCSIQVASCWAPARLAVCIGSESC